MYMKKYTGNRYGTGLIILFVNVIFLFNGHCQENYLVRTVVFYNLENLFDIKNDSLVHDDDRTPTGKYNWTQEKYETKLNAIAKVLSEIGKDRTGTTPDIIGVCEVETKNVLLDLISTTTLKDYGYQIIHFNSPDERGIDVALLYKESSFLPIAFNSHRLLLFNEKGFRDYTRDQLVVTGIMDGEKLSFIVNHWPSRSGGEKRSRPNRIKAALLNKRIIDSIRRENPLAKIMSMGDLNDDPRDASLKTILRTKGKLKALDSLSLYNPMEKLYKQGLGTLAYRDRWNLFDQFLLTPSLVTTNRKGLHYWQAHIFSPDYLMVQEGRYKGYPFRTYVGTTYQGGYADHFPVYLYLLKKVTD